MPAVELLGPIKYHMLFVHGSQVPFLTATPWKDGTTVTLLLDNRLALDVPMADLDRVTEFIADCIAVASGYTSHPREGREPMTKQPYRRWRGPGGQPAEEGHGGMTECRCGR